MAQRKLEVVFVGDTASLDRAVGKAGKSTDSFGGKLGKLTKPRWRPARSGVKPREAGRFGGRVAGGQCGVCGT
jgi:hypothetical protein